MHKAFQGHVMFGEVFYDLDGFQSLSMVFGNCRYEGVCFNEFSHVARLSSSGACLK